jgi:hypothetical protein
MAGKRPSTKQRLAALAEREWIKEIVLAAQGDPRLTVREERFIAEMRQFVDKVDTYAGYPDEWRLSHKKVAWLQDISNRVESDYDEFHTDDDTDE